MSEEENSSNQDKQDNVATKETWWRKNIKALGTEAPVLMIIGVLIGIILSFIFLIANPDLFIQPIISNSVRATLEAQTTVTLTTPPAQIDSNSTPNLKSIEDFPGEFYSYSGNGGFGQLNVINKEKNDFDYRFYYDMPQDGEGYAGIFFAFTPTRNFAEFTSLQLAISFGDENAICEIYLQGQDGRKSYITLHNNQIINASDDAKMEIAGGNRIFTIPLLNNFLNVPNKQSIAGIGVSIKTSHIEGAHSCTIHDIYLLK